MNIILFDDCHREQLLPLTFTRPQSEIRVGILTLKEKWEKHLQSKASYLTQAYLAKKYPLHIENNNWFISASLCPDDALIREIKQLKTGQTLIKNGIPLAHCLSSLPNDINTYCGEKVEYSNDCLMITHLWDIFYHNETELRADFALLTKNRTSEVLSSSNTLIGDAKDIFIEEGAVVEASIINVKDSKIYIGKNAEVMEGSMFRGSIALCEHAQIKMGAKIYGATTIGPYSKVGGEVNNVVIFGYSNKAHDGFFGNSVIGEWCNIGADSNTSNLKNNYTEVKLWNYPQRKFEKTGLIFCGLIMADHVKCGINTMFNTGSVIGVASNVFGADYMPNFVGCFKWGGAKSINDCQIGKFFPIAESVFQRRHKNFEETEKEILLEVYNQAKSMNEPQF